VLGDDHPATLNSINNMGFVLQAQRKLVDAEPLYREALDRRRRVLGDDHPDTLSSVNNMGFLLLAQGRLDDTEPLYREALQRSRRVLGDDHPNTLSSINNMGFLLQSQGKLSEAEPYYEELYRRAPKSPLAPRDVASSVARYGVCLARLGKHERAAVVLVEARERLRAIGMTTGPAMRDVLTALADVSQKANRPDDAAHFRAELASLQVATRAATGPTTSLNSSP
jgi:tetratricopeptide (TPR) repeat protein